MREAGEDQHPADEDIYGEAGFERHGNRQQSRHDHDDAYHNGPTYCFLRDVRHFHCWGIAIGYLLRTDALR